MRGEILYYETGADVGLIRGADGGHYRFRLADLDGQPPTSGAYVEFEPRDSEWASRIVVKGADGPLPEKLDIWGYFAKCMRMSFNGVGRARRLEYWSFILFSFLMLIGLFLVIIGIGAVGQMRAGDAFGESFSLLAAPILLIAIILFIPASITVLIRRLHDIGWSGWLVLLQLVPLGGFILFICTLMSSERGANKHGPYPKAV
ncbi:MAG: DUF805 domain-containing protein [Hyphomonadaceae bacterium JAD_PAG50586_4]|nr:MAG: DUF805 domain-containing protein [Hyphomonadaceae bacterium JAD_PAG50586_4]